jgi:hypothetical protein
MAIDYSTLFIEEAMGIILLMGFISSLLVFVNDNLTKLGKYHTQKTRYNSDGEDFILKVIKVFAIYVSLFPLVCFSIYITLKFLPFSNTQIGYQGIITLTPLFSIVFLIVMRFLMNPTWDNVEKVLKIRGRESDYESIKKVAEVFKERILTFFSSYISLTLIVFVLYAIIEWYIVVQHPSELPNAMNSIVSINNLPDPDTASALIKTYFSVLIFFMVAFEILLWIYVPIIQTNWEVRRQPKPLTVENFEKFRLSTLGLIHYNLNKDISFIRQIPSNFIPSLKVAFETINRRNKHLNKKRNFSYYYMAEMNE